MPKKKELAKYTTIHIPTNLAKLIDNLIDSEDFAYSSRSEFVKDAIRRSLEKHGFYPSSSWLQRALSNPTLLEELTEKIKQLKELRSLSLASNLQ